VSAAVSCARTPGAPEEKILARYSRDYFWKEYLPSLGVVDGQYDLTQFDLRHSAVLQMIAAQAPGRRLLEVGCGAGFFLKAAERAEWRVEGIELSAEASGFAAGRLQLPIRRERAEDAPIEAGSFDAAVMFDVIEHLFDPRAVLSAIARALAPGGTLVMTTPNFDSASRYLLGVDWAVLSPLEHMYYFTEDSLRRQLAATGFSDVRFERQHVMWGPQETINFRYTHGPNGIRAGCARSSCGQAAVRSPGSCSAPDARTRYCALRRRLDNEQAINRSSPAVVPRGRPRNLREFHRRLALTHLGAASTHALTREVLALGRGDASPAPYVRAPPGG